MVNSFWRRDTAKFVLLQVLVTNSLFCLSSVTGGAAKCNTKTVIPEVNISSSPPDRTQPIGAAISLICEARSRAADKLYPRRFVKFIQWYDPNGTPIGVKCQPKQPLNKLSCPLLLKNLTEENFGNYTCEAENDYAGYCRRKSIEIRRKVNLSSPETTKAPRFLFPEIAENPMNQSVFIGSNVTFNCTATGIPTPAISWMKNNNSSDVTSNVRANVQGDKNNHSRLIITEVKKEDSGRYQCVATNSAGKRTSSEAFLHTEDLEKVSPPETTNAPHFLFPEIAENPMNQSVFIGSNVTFNCTATGIPTPAISWMKNNNSSEVTSNVRANVQGDKNNHSRLIITEVKKEDSGRYQCVATNSAGKRTSSEAFLHTEDLGKTSLYF
ncbi:muscle, skeletal receptor tyrosine-protein kinase-like [Stylophora pistillata]|uniref:muscle, skeletal receptor tyrosine-protein kinase-like n=1 Tax=Stylophora pistillata TaxID=50429 RepID=UPI000C04D681|nr:muscle, skeletal receptor tyrosine-protein kinase-like [Stylophora pistillata]